MRFLIKRAAKKGTVQMLLIGLCLGVTLGIAFVDNTIFDCGHHQSSNSHQLQSTILTQQQRGRKSQDSQSPIIRKLVDKVKLKRPRYFSTELGLRKKLLVGIILSDLEESHIANLVAINQTLSPKVDKFVFFVGGGESQSSNILKQLKSIFGLSGVVIQVPGTETNSSRGEKESHLTTVNSSTNYIDYNLVAIKVIKYFGDKFVDKFDYFAIFLDNYYINGRLLAESVSRMSVSQEIFWGWPAAGNSCALESGFVISRKIVQKISSKIERCLLHPTLKLDYSLSKCLDILLSGGKYSCEKLAQDRVLYSTVPYDAPPDKLKLAITVGPIKDPTDMYRVHEKICLSRYSEIQSTIHKLQNKIQSIIPSLPSNYQIPSWPLGVSRGTTPKSRFEIIKWIYFDTSQMYSKTEVSTISHIEGIDREDLNHVINFSKQFLNKSSPLNSNNFYFDHGYRRLNPSRGMEYLLNFKSSSNNNIIRVEGIRPLCKTELLSIPYVTENRRVTIIVPVTSAQKIPQIRQFLDRYFDVSIDQKLNTVLILALIIKKNKDSQSSVKSQNNIFTSDSLRPEQIQEIKSLVSYYNGKTAQNVITDSIKVGYIIIPSFASSNPYKSSSGYLTTIDAVIKKIVGPSALILTVDVNVNLRDEFLNRVRMNTIMKWQTFSPIPFLEYNPSVYQPLHNNKMSIAKENENGRLLPPVPNLRPTEQRLEVSKNSGYFDTTIYRYFSFFASDYVTARKSTNSSIVTKLESVQDFSALEQLFLSASSLHILRAPEPNLIVPFTFPSGCSSFEDCAKSNWGSRSLLAKTIFASRQQKSQ